jgi:hypothetical protein
MVVPSSFGQPSSSPAAAASAATAATAAERVDFVAWARRSGGAAGQGEASGVIGVAVR